MYSTTSRQEYKEGDEMSKTKEILNKLPEVAVRQIEYLKYEYSHSDHNTADIRRRELRAYLQGLEDAGLLKQSETRLMYCYGTL